LLDIVVSPGATGRTPRVNISSISGTGGAAPCTVNTASPHGLTTGDTVTISGVTGGSFGSPINAAFQATVTSPTSFTVPVVFNSGAGSAGTVTGATVTSAGSPTVNISGISTGNPSCTVTTSSAHGLRTGDTVLISGVSGGTFTGGSNAINAEFVATVLT